ncbi:hypothetical protein [Bradyrhizobium sp. ERR14]|uniref:hypothetical protein n=1 Tax=Bradyrhizobium sp. ERR14 TaxID=2663837 RepID=UPI001609AE6F|nr:hypothetical protein [Bradyrhizobium sp. ERR14]MBB4395165.1 hypothetical protein [Bradyrhizobium sp. ERR14]
MPQQYRGGRAKDTIGIATAPAKLEGHAITVLETQRDIAGRDYVAASGISTRIIHRWHESLGPPPDERGWIAFQPSTGKVRWKIDGKWLP